MRRLLALLMIAPLTGCGAHLHRPIDEQLANVAADKVEVLDWDEAFAADRAQRDAIAEREDQLGLDYADARREAELLDVLNEPVGERAWAKFEDRFIALAACMLDEPGSSGGRACRARVDDRQREVARALLFDACPAEGCAWIEATLELRTASAVLAVALANYDRARALAGLGDAVATPAQCPAPTRLPARLREQGQALEQACAGYDLALAAVVEALPESSGLREAIVEVRALVEARDGYRGELRLLVAELASLRFEGTFDNRELEQQVAHYLELQAKYALSLAGARLGDFGDLALEGTLMITREHRAAIVRMLAQLGAIMTDATSADVPAPEDQPTTETFRTTDDAGGTAPPPPDPTAPTPPRQPDPVPPRPIPEPPQEPEDPSISDVPTRRVEASADAELLRSLGATLVSVFGDTWRTLDDGRRAGKHASLLLSAELERIQIDAMSRRLAFAEERVWLELALIETQLLALLRLRAVLATDWIPATRPSAPERLELERLELDCELAEAALDRAQTKLESTIAHDGGKPSKTGTGQRTLIADAKHRVAEAQAELDRANDAYHRHLLAHGSALCRRQGSVSQSYERDAACVGPIERLVGLHAELTGVSLPRLESLDRSAVRRKDEASLLRDQAGLEIRITYIAASVAALQRFTAGGLEADDVAAIIGGVVGIGLGAAITAGVYAP
jgi:hypothetical protein